MNDALSQKQGWKVPCLPSSENNSDERQSSNLSSTALAAGGNNDRCDHLPWRSTSWFRVSWPRVILRALHIPEMSPKHLTVNDIEQKMVRAGVKGAAFLPDSDEAPFQ